VEKRGREKNGDEEKKRDSAEESVTESPDRKIAVGESPALCKIGG